MIKRGCLSEISDFSVVLKSYVWRTFKFVSLQDKFEAIYNKDYSVVKTSRAGQRLVLFCFQLKNAFWHGGGRRRCFIFAAEAPRCAFNTSLTAPRFFLVLRGEEMPLRINWLWNMEGEQPRCFLTWVAPAVWVANRDEWNSMNSTNSVTRRTSAAANQIYQINL